MSVENGTIAIPIEELAGADARDTALKLRVAGFLALVLYPDGVVDQDEDGTKPKTAREPMGTRLGLASGSRPTQINARFDKFPDAGVGICLGPDRGPEGRWLIDIEGDGPEAEESRLKLLGRHATRDLRAGPRRAAPTR